MADENSQAVELAALNAVDAIAAIAAGDFPAEMLAEMRTMEEGGKARKTVLAAIDARLSPPPAGGSVVTTSAGAVDPGRPPHKPNCELPNQHDGAPCTNCGVSEIVWRDGLPKCTYCGYRWK